MADPLESQPLRAVVAGARRVRQGTGPYVARYLAECGVEIAAVVGTTPASVEQAQSDLKSSGVGEPSGYTSLEAALEVEAPQIVALCSPFAAHAEQLPAVAAAGCDCLCEKPLYWPIDGLTRDPIEGFQSSGLLLEPVLQWPHVIATFEKLFPSVRDERIDRFEMGLGPISRGATMVLDAAPHMISVLRALAGPFEVEDASAASDEPAHDDLTIRFGAKHAGGVTEAVFRFVYSPEPPRPAWIAINGCRADRRISLPGYRLELIDGGRSVALPDPLRSLVEAFVGKVRRRAGTDYATLRHDLTRLKRLIEAVGALEH